jgi:hypothetical protein
MAWGSLVAHLRSIGGAGGLGVASGDGRQRGSGGKAAAARTPAMLGHPVRVEARVGAREKLRVVGWQKVREEQQGRRWRQWWMAAGGRVARAHEEKEQGGFYRPGGVPRQLLGSFTAYRS